MATGSERFVPFGAPHLAALAATVLCAVLLAALARRPALAGPLRVLLALSLLALTGLYLAGEIAGGTASVWSFLPLHLCDMAIFVAAFALLTENRLAAELVYFWALAGTSLALVTPDVSTAFPSREFVFYFSLHGAVVVSAAVLVWGLRLTPGPGAPLRAWLYTNLYAALMAVVDLVTGANFLFLRQKPSAPTLLDYLGPWPLYLLAGELVALALFALLYLPFWRRNRRAPVRRPPR